jgi:prepilin-type N-terminal cleavage/methylation domain-containing protein
MNTSTHPNRGFTLVEIMIVVTIIGILATIAVPNFVQARKQAQQKACISNLQQIDGAIQRWALDLNKGEGQPVTYSDISSYLKNAVVCPSGGHTFEDSYTITTVDAPPACLQVPSGPNAHVMPQTQ